MKVTQADVDTIFELGKPDENGIYELTISGDGAFVADEDGNELGACEVMLSEEEIEVLIGVLKSRKKRVAYG